MTDRLDDPAQAPRDRQRTLRVVVNDHERERIEAMAKMAGLSLSAYLRTAGLNHPIRSTLDYDAIMELIRLHADLGRVGGLLKLWLAERRGEVVSAERVDAAFEELRELRGVLFRKIEVL
ncbi:conjugal transfer protein TraJ [Asticcacaulis sp.]|uniref:plasmid mobilization protein n=1 Tax=Asticcacaulis sp. TaxID=1872648 RepID=UPI002613496C|nr:conjugal transfer protein TraJ [Asticcacaulis sp.]